MSSQGWIAPRDKEKEMEEQKPKAKSNAQWRASQYYGSVLNGGNSTGRVIDWASMPRLLIGR
jgi:hypothetical protein